MDWRLVLENPHFGWPDDVVADAARLRDAYHPHPVGDRDMKDPLAAIEALVSPDASYHGHGIYGGQIRIPVASHSDAIRIMREARAALEVMRLGWQSAPEALEPLPRYATVAAAIAAEEPLREFLKAARNDAAAARADLAERILAVLTDIQELVDGAAPVAKEAGYVG